ncbi:uncharacterized protein C7orf31 homolog [Rhinatrema bivittatum]|uniref:uncharacterized protein C7orf31 homolog n=1 Tax=Rhinatrema bivittatum TaxID=194408 RepID=UPI00112E917B|nr:uncharacterized protein C7orf31 homolog [Rhinatrema bivittatum]
MEMPHDLSYYYRQREGASTLPRTFQSTELLTPLQSPQRITVSPERYQQYLQNSPAQPKLPWGREREYGGMGPLSLPANHRPKAEPPPFVAKGHLHYGYGGDPWSRQIPVEQYYDLTQLRRSSVRLNDDLLPKPPSAVVNMKQIQLAFPAEHPYSSHISRFAMFPDFRPPDNPNSTQPPPVHTPTKGYPTTILKKARGDPYRHEVTCIPIGYPTSALNWPGEHQYYHKEKHLLEGSNAHLLQGEHPLGVQKQKGDYSLTGFPQNAIQSSDNTLAHQSSQGKEKKRKDGEQGPYCEDNASRWDHLQIQGQPPLPGQYLDQMRDSKGQKAPDFRKITDTELTDALYKRQLTARPRSPTLLEAKSSQESNISKPEKVHHPWNAEKGQGVPTVPLPMEVSAGTAQAPRPRTTPLPRRALYSKSEAHRRLHQAFPDKTKNLNENIHSGRRHTFFGFNSYYFHN